jgi:hypothetical protein
MRGPGPLDKSVPVALNDQTPWFEWMTENWPDRATARHYRDYVHRQDVARAAQPPVIEVTVPGVPGHFTGTLGGNGVAYTPDLTTALPPFSDSLS